MANLLERIQNVFKDEMATKVDASLAAMDRAELAAKAARAELIEVWVDQSLMGFTVTEKREYYAGRIDQINKALPVDNRLDVNEVQAIVEKEFSGYMAAHPDEFRISTQEPEHVFSVPISSEAFKAQITAEWVEAINMNGPSEDEMRIHYGDRIDQFNKSLPLDAQPMDPVRIEKEAYMKVQDADFRRTFAEEIRGAENESYGYGSIPLESQKVFDPVVVSQVSTGYEIEKYRAETFKNIVSSWVEDRKISGLPDEQPRLYYCGKIDQFNDSLSWKNQGLSAAQISDLRIDYSDVEKQVNMAYRKASGFSEEQMSRMQSQSRGMEI